MTNIVRRCLLLGAACLAPAFADSLMITSPGYGGSGNIMGGVYVNPYDAKLTTASGSSNIKVFCDDFFSDVSIGVPWQVNTTNYDDLPSNITNTRWGNPALPGYAGSAQQALNLYYEAAWLSLQLVAAPTKTQQGQISFALWGIFAPTALNAISLTDRLAATSWITLAQAHIALPGFSASEFSNFVLYTPTPLTIPGSPQEFIAVRTPEPGVAAIWAVNLLAIVGMVSLLRRRISVH